MFGLMVSEPAVCTESGWERFLGIFKELCCTAESCFLGAAVKVLLLSHVKTRQTLRSTAGALVTDPLLLPHATPPLFDFPRNFRGILLPIPNKSLQGNSGSCSCLQTGLSVTSIQQHILQIFQYLPKWIVIYLRVVKKTKNKSSLLI